MAMKKKPAAKPWPKNLPPKAAALEKREEKLHKDLDGDGEKGEPKSHKAKVIHHPPTERKEEKRGRDLDGDGEKGEPKSHQKKVLTGKEVP